MWINLKLLIVGCVFLEISSSLSFNDIIEGFGSIFGADSGSLDAVQLIFYYGPSINDNEKYNLGSSAELTNHPNFDPNKTTTCYIHGYQETQTVESVQVIINAYYKLDKHNLIVIDWSAMVADSYVTAAMVNVHKLGTSLSSEFIQLFDSGLDIESFHLVGHSLGGQLSGDIGRKIISQSNYKLKRITALDPAFPGFFNIIFTQTLSANDAYFVDIIHTDSGLYGSPYSSGTVDFWPNGGTGTQPGCPVRNYVPLSDNDLCSHRRSWRFWAESVANKNGETFLAQPWRSNSNDEIVEMGLHCPTDAYGDYFLRTNRNSPFAIGSKVVDL